MTAKLKYFPLFAFALTLLVAGGCVKYKQIVTVMPDGSGKVQYIVGFSQQMLQMAEGEEDPLAQFTPDAVNEDAKGIVAYTQPIRYEEGGYSFVAFSGYFENINDLEMPGPDDGGAPSSFVWESVDGGAKLTVKGGPLLSMAQEFEAPAAEERQMIQQMMQGMEIVELYVLPGDAEAAEGVTMVDNTAELKVDVNAMLNNAGPLPILKGKESYTLELPELTTTQDQIDAFKAEMAEAIEAWKQMQEAGGE